MRQTIIGTLIVLMVFAATRAITAQAPASPRGTAAKADAKGGAPNRVREAEEKAVRQAADAFVKAYNAHDAKALAALFAPDGEIVDEAGDSRQGRSQIEAVFGAIFDEYPEATMSLEIGAVRLLTPALAEEDGVAAVVHEPGAAPERNRYTALYVKQDGKWMMASARDLPEEPATPTAKLKQLEWLIGDWVDESSESLIATSYRWTDNQCFILGEFKIQVTGREVMTGSQRIGWDPLAKVIRSWVFDSEGGFAEGVYAQDGDRWIVKMTGVTRDGEPASATNVLTSLGKDRMSWQSRDRMVGGQATPDTEAVIAVRSPPKPE
jgi:uncharacterized protein (TIGR02246 family)